MRRFSCAVFTLAMSMSAHALADAATGAADTSRLYLATAVQSALAQHPSVGLAKARRDEARASVRETFAPWFPSLQLSATAMQYEKPMLVYPMHVLDYRRLPLFDRTLVQAGLTLDFTLFDAARGARIRRARCQAQATDAALDATQQALVARVITSFLGALAKREILSAHDRRLAALESELSRVRQRQQVGRAADVEVLRAEAALSGAQADRVHDAAAMDMAERDLGRLIGVPSEQVHSARLVPVAPSDSSTITHDGALSLALQSSPNILQAQRQLDAAQAGRSVARGAWWPALRATAAYVDRGANDMACKAEWNAGLVLSYPLFTGGAVRSAVARADAVERGATEQLRLARNQLAEEIDRALSALDESRARVRSLSAAVGQLTEVVRIEKLSLEAGSGTQTDYLRTEADLLSARAGLVEARHAEIAARAELARLTGQLNSGWIAQLLENQQ
jgi:outer membrane protein